MKLRRIFVQSKKKSFWIAVKENLLSISREMYTGVSEEPKEIRFLAPVDIRYEYPVPLPQSYRLINQGNCRRHLICSPEIIICLENFFAHKRQNMHRTLVILFWVFSSRTMLCTHMGPNLKTHGEPNPHWGNTPPTGSHYRSPSVAASEGSGPPSPCPKWVRTEFNWEIAEQLVPGLSRPMPLPLPLPRLQ